MGVDVKGVTVPALLLSLDTTLTADENIDEIELRLNTPFFNNSRILINTNGLVLETNHINKILKIFEQHNAILLEIKSDFHAKESSNKANVQTTHKKSLLTLNQTIRGGQKIEYDGDVLIFGTVNANAYIVATGNIIVLGTMKGVAHAGASGDETAMVVSLNLKPQQLRIANHIAKSPDNIDELPDIPEKAYITDNSINIEKV
ncbi:MAG: septum site-determining protein MinC [Nitrospirae bacterium]|nr:septum site-determining protein MinC [Nitrospirota bacterium]MBF0533921.1 septum site-determining protein MinC [Nitrospirota bacterium]MBF0618041.1 septum site-determining protein MinC [Nitrospirota bacterium]